jgi:DNA topoisomerase I
MTTTKKSKTTMKKTTTKSSPTKKTGTIGTKKVPTITKKKTSTKPVQKRKKSRMKDGPKLLLVESPSKIKTLSKFLGNDFKIMSTVGHIKDLPQRKIGITVDEKKKTVTLDYVTVKDKTKTIADICKQASRSSEVFLASDPDREGEIISWHIAQEIKKVFADPEKIHRITFNEITEPAVVAAIENKHIINEEKVQAQQARRVLDRWVGYEVSPILWKKIAKGLSAGRVQSVALLLIVNRDEEIVNFKPEESWSIHALFLFKNKTDLPAELFKINNKAFKLKNKKEADIILSAIKKEQFIVSKITEKKRAKKPLPPFMTSTLQQDAYNKLGFSVSRTMSVAQKLYEGLPLTDKNKPEALITYMRTDSLRISDTAIKDSRSFIKKNFGEKYLPKTSIQYGKKGAQDAHEAIRPIKVSLTPDKIKLFLKDDEAKLYGLIWKRFTACQMTPAEYFQRQVLVQGGKYTFKATGSTLIFDGFLKVYLVEDEESKKTINIPKYIKEQESLSIKKAEGKQHFTQPPPRYSEATLVKELEKQGIGRPSTYVTILSTIQKRGYVDKDNKRFTATELGKAVTQMLVKNLPDIINVKFTAMMEEELDKVAQGELTRDKVLFDFYEPFQKDLKEFGGKEVSRRAVETDIKCSTCKNILVIRFSRSGEFLGCSKYPECKFTTNFERNEKGIITMKKPEVTEETDISCPNCGKKLVQKMGKFGPFMACPGYPDCKYIHQETMKMPCPQCKSKVAKRKWRRGSFWGCTGYPKCKFSIFGEIKEEPCPKCKSPYLLVTKNKDKNEKLSCPNKECGYVKE